LPEGPVSFDTRGAPARTKLYKEKPALIWSVVTERPTSLRASPPTRLISLLSDLGDRWGNRDRAESMESVPSAESRRTPSSLSRRSSTPVKGDENIPWSSPDISEEERRAINRVLDSGWLGMGPITKEFEAGICGYVGTSSAIFVNNGTSALMAAYLANGIGPGDAVLVPTYTFVATVSALLAIGARPILVDCDPTTLNVDPKAVEQLATEHPEAKALVFVDLAGQPCDIDALREIAKRHSLALIEDAAESFGAGYRNKSVGDFDHTTVFSFHIAKQLTTIEGGAIVTNDREVAEKVRLIRSHGEGPDKYIHVAHGLNFRPTDIQAAIGLVQLGKMEKFLALRQRLAQAYRVGLGEWLEFQRRPDFVSRPTYMLFVAFCHDASHRDGLNSWLNYHGIDTRIPFPPVHTQPFYEDRFGKSSMPGSELAFSRVISLPIGNAITEAQVGHVVDCARQFFER
jgi:perosamine synthetase